jgi:BatD DUF11 like domain
MRSFRLHIILFVLLLSWFTGFAQDGSLSLRSSANTVAVGQQFRVTVQLEGGKAQAYKDPAFNGFRIIGKSSSSGSGGMTLIVNGQPIVQGNGSASWTYTLIPVKEGNYTVGPAKVKVNGGWISSNTATINVGKSSGQNQQQTNATSDNTTNDDALFLRAEVDKKSVYIGEQIIVTYKLYTSIPVLQYVIDEAPSFVGFWMENLLDDKKDPVQYITNINGKDYAVAEVRKSALFPQQTGSLQLDVQKLKTLIQVKKQTQNNNPFSDIFGDDPFFQQIFQMNEIQNQERVLTSNPISVFVKELPSAAPTDFKGAVGSFKIKTKYDKKHSYSTNETITIQYIIEGSGNIALIDELGIEFPEEFDSYEPEIREEIRRSTKGISGEKVFEYIVIPRVKGKYKLAPFKFSYFDLNSNSYVELESDAIVLDVNKGEDNVATVSGAIEVDYINEDIRFIKTDNLSLSKDSGLFYASLLYFGLLVFPLLVFVILIFVWRKRIKDNANIVDYKRRKANKTAAKHLKQAKVLLVLQDEEAFYLEVSRALWGYLSNKFNMSVSDLSIDNVREEMIAKELQEENINLFIKTLDDCEFARFAPGESKDIMQVVYNKSVNVILAIEEEIS